MFYQEPDALTPSIQSSTWHYQKATEDRPESLSFRAGIARIGALPLLYLPGYTLYPENNRLVKNTPKNFLRVSNFIVFTRRPLGFLQCALFLILLNITRILRFSGSSFFCATLFG